MLFSILCEQRELSAKHEPPKEGLVIEEREKEFTYYCKNCDHGTFSKDLHERHLQTEKHKKYVKRQT